MVVSVPVVPVSATVWTPAPSPMYESWTEEAALVSVIGPPTAVSVNLIVRLPFSPSGAANAAPAAGAATDVRNSDLRMARLLPVALGTILPAPRRRVQ